MDFSRPISEMSEEEMKKELELLRATRRGVGTQKRSAKSRSAAELAAKQGEEVILDDAPSTHNGRKQRKSKEGAIQIEL